MWSLLRVLVMLLIGLRLLVPPGLCLCQASAPAARLVVALLGGEEPPVSEEEDHEHHPGCPASFLATGLGVQPAGPQMDDSQAIVSDVAPSVLACSLTAIRKGPRLTPALSANLPLFLGHCALLL